MSIGKRTVLDDHLGRGMSLMGANVAEKVFRLRDDQGNDYLFQVIGDKRTITDIIQLPADAERPRGTRRDDELAPVTIFPYDKQDNFRHAITPGTPFGDAQWNRGYVLVDGRNGHPWLRIGVHNYRSTRSRAVFEWTYSDDLDEEGDDDATVE